MAFHRAGFERKAARNRLKQPKRRWLGHTNGHVSLRWLLTRDEDTLIDMEESPVERWGRLTNPQTVEDYWLCVDTAELLESDEGRRIVEEEIMPYLPLGPA